MCVFVRVCGGGGGGGEEQAMKTGRVRLANIRESEIEAPGNCVQVIPLYPGNRRGLQNPRNKEMKR